MASTFAGDLSDFSIIDTLYYIHYSQHTGVLNIDTDDTTTRKLYFHRGQCVQAVAPGLVKMGDVLREWGHVDGDELKQALHHQKHIAPQSPLGEILQTLNMATHAMIRDSIIFQIETALYDLIQLKSGTFTFDQGPPPKHIDMGVAVVDVLLPEEVNTAYMMLNALRKFDEREAASDMAEDVSTSPTSDMGFTLALLKEMLSSVNLDEHGDVTAQFLSILSEHVQRAIFFTRRGEYFVGIGGFGPSIGQADLKKFCRRLRVMIKNSPLLQQKTALNTSFIGLPPDEKWLHDLYQWIGTPQHPGILILPMRGSEDVTAFVYGDNGNQPQPIHNKELLEVVTAQMGLLLENIWLRRRLKQVESS